MVFDLVQTRVLRGVFGTLDGTRKRYVSDMQTPNRQPYGRWRVRNSVLESTDLAAKRSRACEIVAIARNSGLTRHLAWYEFQPFVMKGNGDFAIK